MGPAAQDRSILSVSELARQARLHIEERFNLVWVEGEISNFRRPASGHWYFSLKDDSAQIRCAMFAGRNRHAGAPPRDGAQVIVRGRVSLYEPRGDFQIIADHLEPAGEGALRAAFEALKQKLAAEGLFDDARKRTLPPRPRHVAIISSPSGAALHDVLHVVARRFPAMAVTIVPASVQGEDSERQVLHALDRVALLEPDVVLLTRGGGSLEDLWTFNLESVARAVAACPIPTVVAVGHQTDFAIAEFTADLRAPTPSAAAELITPDAQELSTLLDQLRARLLRTLAADMHLRRNVVDRLRAQLVDPRQGLIKNMQRTDDLEERLRMATHYRIDSARGRLWGLTRSLRALRPQPLIRRRWDQLNVASAMLGRHMNTHLHQRRDRLVGTARTLNAVSPLDTLNRGYAVLAEWADQGRGAAITSTTMTRPGETIGAHLRDGLIKVQVQQIDSNARLTEAAHVDSNQ